MQHEDDRAKLHLERPGESVSIAYKRDGTLCDHVFQFDGLSLDEETTE